MACNSIRGLQIDACSPNIGGIKAIYLAEWAENAATIKVAEGDNATELIDGSVSGFATEVTWTKYDIRKNTASMTSTINNSTDGASYVTTELSLVFSKMEAKKRIAIQALAIGECIAVVEDSNGEMYFLGKDAPLTVTAGGGETGAEKSARNAYTLTLTDESLGLPMFLDESAKKVVKGITE